MKSLIAIFGFLAVINVAFCYDDSLDEVSSSHISTSRYLEYLKQRRQLEYAKRKFEAVCPGKDEEFSTAFLKMKDCVDGIDDTEETACSTIQTHMKRCSKPLFGLLEECIPEQSQGVPTLVLDAIISGSKYLCKTDGEHIFELANNCIFRSNLRSDRCERRIRAKVQQYGNKPPTKKQLCEIMQSFKPCLHNHLQDSCGHRITRESFQGLFDAMMVPCQSFSTGTEYSNVENEVELLS